MDISGDKRLSNEIVDRVETSRFGPLTFQIGVDEHEAQMLLRRVADAQLRFWSSLLSRSCGVPLSRSDDKASEL
jgi:hypothetical protein